MKRSQLRSVGHRDELLDCLESLRRKGPDDEGFRRIEIYHRAARTRRVTLDPAGVQTEHVAGCDEGVALRGIRTHDRGAVFTAASGSLSRTTGVLVDRARSSPPVVHGGQLETFDREVEDLDAGELPGSDEMLEWLHRARNALLASGASPGPVECSLDAAATTETWLAGSAAHAVRRRLRCWAIARPLAGGRPLISASRGWPGIDAGEWGRLAHERGPEAPSAGSPSRLSTLLFNAETAADLVYALVRSAHAPGTRAGAAVGPGWSLSDRPRDHGALYGVRFDDSVSPTRDKTLADGRALLAGFDGAGHDRRPSFRDAPAPHPCNIVVTAPEAEPPPGTWPVSRMRLHVLAPDHWVIETPNLPGKSVFFSTSPCGLMRACAGVWGACRESHRAVRTPPLLFADIRAGSEAGSR